MSQEAESQALCGVRKGAGLVGGATEGALPDRHPGARALTYSATVWSEAGVTPDSNCRMTLSGSDLACKAVAGREVTD